MMDMLNSEWRRVKKWAANLGQASSDVKEKPLGSHSLGVTVHHGSRHVNPAFFLGVVAHFFWA